MRYTSTSILQEVAKKSSHNCLTNSPLVSAINLMFYHSLDQIMILININSRMQSLPDYLVGHYKNIVLARADFAKLVNNTQLAKIFQKSSHTKYFLNNISDIIRVVLLWQFGGTYLDSDVISLKPVPDQASHSGHPFNQKANLNYLIIRIRATFLDNSRL